MSTSRSEEVARKRSVKSRTTRAIRYRLCSLARHTAQNMLRSLADELQDAQKDLDDAARTRRTKEAQANALTRSRVKKLLGLFYDRMSASDPEILEILHQMKADATPDEES